MGVEDMHEQVPPTELEYLSNIALKIYHSDSGSFLRTFADAWLLADSENRPIIQQGWEDLIEKYGLDKEAEA